MSSEYKFYGYQQSNGLDTKEVESTLDRVYETIIQSALRARAKREQLASDANKNSLDFEA